MGVMGRALLGIFPEPRLNRPHVWGRAGKGDWGGGVGGGGDVFHFHCYLVRVGGAIVRVRKAAGSPLKNMLIFEVRVVSLERANL